MQVLRSATEEDLDWLTEIDLEDEGITGSEGVWSPQEFADKRLWLQRCLADDPDSMWIG